MLKKLHVLLLVLLAAVCFTATAWADYDYIEQYGVMVTPNTEDGSLLITVKLEWTPLEELPYGQELKIGVPNGSIRDVAAQTDNIERLDFDNSYMYVYLDRAYEANETFSFAYSWVQEYMYQLSTNGVIEDYDNVHYDYVTYDYTAGWFDEAKIGQMTLVWNDPAGLTGQLESTGTASAEFVRSGDKLICTAEDLGYGETMGVSARYENWPVQLSEENSLDNIPSDYDPYVYVPCEHFEDDTGDAIIGMMVTIFVVIFIFVLISAARRGDGYAGGFGTRYVFVNHLWYPAGPDGRPRPGSVGTPEEVAAASAAEAGAAALAEAVSAAAATVPAPAAAPVLAPAPVLAAAGPGAAPRTSMARCIWTRSLPGKWSNKKWRAPPAHAIFAIFMPPAPRSPRRRRSSRCRSYGRCGRTPLASTFLFMRCSILL